MEFSFFTKLEIPETSGHNSNICRICLQKNHNLLVSLFDKQKSPKSTIASIVTYVSGVEILQNDLYPQLICNECLSRFQDAADIKKKCIESDQKLKSNWLHPEFELKQEKDVDDYYDQNDFADSYNDDSEFLEFPLITVEPIEVKTEKKEVKKEEESDEEYLPAKYKKTSKTKTRQNAPNPYKRTTKQKKREPVPEGNVCRNCSKSYTDKYVLKLHLNRCKEIYYFCEICRQTIKYKSDFDKHVKKHEVKGEYITICEFCNQKLYTREAIKQHPCLKKEEIIKCPICHAEFLDIKDFTTHCQDHRVDKVFKCTKSDCGKIFKNAREFYYHVDSHLQPGNVCGSCDKYFIDQWQLKVHRSTHKAQAVTLIFTCDYCGKGLTRKNRLLVHMNRHFKTRSVRKKRSAEELLCDQCSKPFKGATQLQRHQIREHGATGEFQCNLCSDWFILQSDLAKHMKSHNKPKIVCNICQLSDFKNGQELKIHVELVHNRITKHQCQTCFKSFKYAWHLDTHNKIHTGEKDFECTVCGKAFISKPALSEHMRMHTGEMPYACNICPDKRYRSRKGIARHYKEFHKLETLPKLKMSKPDDPVRPIPLLPNPQESYSYPQLSHPMPMNSYYHI